MKPEHNIDGIEFFNRWSRTYDRGPEQFFIDIIHCRALELVGRVENGRAPETILDIGCGTGRLLSRAGLRWPPAHLVGVDASPGMLEMARRRLPIAAFFTGYAERLPLPGASADVALSTISFHHWEDQAAGVAEIARVLRPGGVFCLADASMPYGISRLVRHFAGNSPAAWREIFTRAGLEVVHAEARLVNFMLLMVGRKKV